MSRSISCDQHGDNAATFVCRHVAASTADGPVEGFDCFVDSAGEWQAICGACGETMMSLQDEDARDAFTVEVCVMICFGCFREAAAVHGVEIP